MKVDLSKVKAYGDTLNDGAVQLSFTLPVPAGDEAREAARQLALKMGLETPAVTEMADLGAGFSFVFTAAAPTLSTTRHQDPQAGARGDEPKR